MDRGRETTRRFEGERVQAEMSTASHSPFEGAPLGLIGLGLLGSSLAERLLAGGFRLIGTDLDPKRRAELRNRGGLDRDTAIEVVRDCERFILCLPTSDIVAQVIDEVEPALREGQLILDATTGSPGQVETLGARLESRGVQYLDTTISGSSEQARHGDVAIMAGGDETAFASCRDILHCLARAVFQVGPCGAGTRMKLATNLVLGLNRAALAEGLSFARALGLDPALTLEILRQGAAYSRVMDTKGPRMIAGDFSPQARLAQHRKDVDLIVGEARRTRAHIPLSELHRALLLEAEAAGLGEADNSAIVRVFETAAVAHATTEARRS
jgi:3-hydroxyisobutyrate dehydrogenase-like beta-hydroxyacid dehydrogenase